MKEKEAAERNAEEVKTQEERAQCNAVGAVEHQVQAEREQINTNQNEDSDEKLNRTIAPSLVDQAIEEETLRVLVLRNNQMGNDEPRAFSSSLATNLNLSNNLGEQEAMLQALRDLSANNIIGDVVAVAEIDSDSNGAGALAERWRNNLGEQEAILQVLRGLSANNIIGDVGESELALQLPPLPPFSLGRRLPPPPAPMQLKKINRPAA